MSEVKMPEPFGGLGFGMVEVRMGARAVLRCMVAVSAPDHEQIGELEALLGADSDSPAAEASDPIKCFRCGVTAPRGDWQRNDRACPFCGRYKLP